jgi:hypothetical protein
MAERAEPLPLTLAFGALREQPAPAEDSKHLLHVERVLFQRGRMDQAIVHIDRDQPTPPACLRGQLGRDPTRRSAPR